MAGWMDELNGIVNKFYTPLSCSYVEWRGWPMHEFFSWQLAKGSTAWDHHVFAKFEFTFSLLKSQERSQPRVFLSPAWPSLWGSRWPQDNRERVNS